MNLFKKKKKEKYPTDSAPRSVAELTKAYTEEAARAGQAQYQIFVHTEELRQINDRLVKLNQEANLRQKLDAQAKAEADKAKTEGAANV